MSSKTYVFETFLKTKHHIIPGSVLLSLLNAVSGTIVLCQSYSMVLSFIRNLTVAGTEVLPLMQALSDIMVLPFIHNLTVAGTEVLLFRQALSGSMVLSFIHL